MEIKLGAGRVLANNYQIVVCDDPTRSISDEENWDDDAVTRGFAGGRSFRMIGTEADLNDHWVELVASPSPPKLDGWQRVTCVHFHSLTGQIHVMSVVDDEPSISAEVRVGDYAVYVAGQNLGVDQLSLGEERRLSDDELAQRSDLEWYRIFVVPGMPPREGRLIDK